MDANYEHEGRILSPYLSPLGAWAFALGTSIGWGSLVVTSNTYLLQAGPWGSIIGLVIGAIVMVIIARNYHYMINCFPDAGGAYTYAKEIFGHDFGFLTAWFLTLTYIAMFWANATSLPLFAHYFIGDIYRFGLHYTIFGYDVYLGETLLSIAAIMLAALICIRSRKAVMYAMIGLAIILSIGITACFVCALCGFNAETQTMEPGFIPDKNAVSQIILIACISPWAFIGFENISHSAEEFRFSRTKVFRIMLIAIVVATLLYVFVLLLSVMAYPPGYDSWLAYISDLGNLDGIEGLPAFYAAYHYMGDAGIGLLMLALFALIATSLIGNIVALSRLLHALAKDSVIKKGIGKLTVFGTPARAILLIAAFSFVLPFFGRTAIGWIVDVTTIGATIIYGFVSISAFKVANTRGDTVERFTGLAGLILMIAFGVYLLLPSLLLSRTLEPESYFLFAVWGILGFSFFRVILKRDKEHRFGRSIIVWIGLLSLVMFASFVWMNQSLNDTTDEAMQEVLVHYTDDGTVTYTQADNEKFIKEEMNDIDESNLHTVLIALGLIAIASVLLLTNFSYVSRWAKKSEEELDQARVIIYTDPLTGLPSMARFQELVQAGIQELFSQGKQPVVVALKLMGLRAYSAEHGSDASERLLCNFADLLSKHFGAESCAHFADELFYAYIDEKRVDACIDSLFKDFAKGKKDTSLPVKVGAYVCNEGEDVLTIGLDRARAAADSDSKTWQSHVTWFTDIMDDEAKMRLYVLHHVDQAIAERWIRPYYQAIIRSKTGEVCGEEALARWIDPEYGFLSPGQFIPILEEAGLLHKVDMHMVDCILEDMQAKRALGIPVVTTSVNISLRDLGQVNIADEISSKVKKAGIPPKALHIEFTESAATSNPELFHSEINGLRDVGLEVWMDDFGSGYSSLNSLKDFKFDVVKLDMDFLRGSNGEKTWDIIAGTIQIIQTIGMQSLAEGVEDEMQAERLKDIGCDMLQGFFYTKPRSLEEVIELYQSEAGIRFEQGQHDVS